MSVIYKDIDDLSQKSTVAGTEKLPVSDTQYITPEQIATSKRVHLTDEDNMPASPEANTLYLIDSEETRQTAIPVGGFKPNVLYVLGTITGNKTFSLESPKSSTMLSHYYWTFNTGTTAPTITWPSEITSWVGGTAPIVTGSKHYEISVLEGVGAFIEV